SMLRFGPRPAPCPGIPPDAFFDATRTVVRTSGAGAIPPVLTTYQIVSFAGACAAISARKTRDVAEFAWADAGMITEEAREMCGLRKTEALAEFPERGVLPHPRVQRPFHPHDVEIELRRDA